MKQKLKFYLMLLVACIGQWSCDDDPLADNPNDDERSSLAKTGLLHARQQLQDTL